MKRVCAVFTEGANTFGSDRMNPESVLNDLWGQLGVSGDFM